MARRDALDAATMPVQRWRTPLTPLPDREVGSARLTTVLYHPGTYRMEGVMGYEFFRLDNDARVRCLQRRGSQGGKDVGHGWQEWMVDDPLHWYGMRERVRELPAGRVWVAGLGLGLMLHHLVQRSDITAITVVDIEPDVVALIQPTLPPDPRVRIVVDDWYAFIQREQPHPDGVLWDLAVGEREVTGAQLQRGRLMHFVHLPEVPMYAFGVRGPGPVYDPAKAQREARRAGLGRVVAP